MADTDVKLRLIIEAVNKAGKQIQDVVDNLNNVSASATRMSKNLGTIGTSGVSGLNAIKQRSKEISKNFDILTSRARRSGTTIGRAMNSTGRAFDRVIVKIKKMGDSMRTSLDKGRASLQKLKVSTGSLGAAFTKLKDTSTKLKDMSTKLGYGVKAAIVAAIYSVIRLGRFILSSAADFEKAMSEVEAVAQGTTEQMSQLADEARRLGAETKFTAVEAAEGLRFLAMAGLDVDESLAALEPVLDLAAAGSLEVSRAADIATNVMSAMNLEVSDLNHVMDVMAHTAANSNTNIEQMAQALKYAAPIAAAAGIDIDELGALIGRLGSNGIQASMAGTSLRGMIISLAAPTTRAKNALEELGVEVAKNNDGSIDLTETLRRLQEAGIGVSEANDIFRRRAAAAALALAKETEKVDELSESNRKADGEIKKMADTMLRNLVGAVTILKSAFTGLAIDLGTTVLPALTLFADGLTKLTNIVISAKRSFAGLPDIIKNILLGRAGQILQLVNSIQSLREETRKYETILKSLENARNVEIKSMVEIENLTDKEAATYGRALNKKIKYYKTAEEYSKTEAGRVKGLNKLTDEYHKKWEEAENAVLLVQKNLKDSNIDLAKIMEAPIENLEEFEKTAKKAYQNAISQVEEYEQKILEAEQKIRFERLDIADKIRELNRDIMSDEAAHADRKLQLEEKLNQVREISAKERETLTKQDIELAEKLLSESKSLAIGLAEEVTKTVKSLNSGLKEETKEVVISSKEVNTKLAEDALHKIKELSVGLIESERVALENSKDVAQKSADAINEALNKIDKDRKIGVNPTLVGLREFEESINALIAKMSKKKIYISIEPQESDAGIATEVRSKGGPAFKATRGMKLPGESKKDSILVKARPGEWFVHNEAVHVWDRLFGKGFMEGINAPWSSFGQKIKNTLINGVPKFNFGGIAKKRFSPKMPLPSYTTGGQIGGIKNLGIVSLNVGTNAYPVLGDVQVMKKLKEAIERENLMRTNN